MVWFFPRPIHGPWPDFGDSTFRQNLYLILARFRSKKSDESESINKQSPQPAIDPFFAASSRPR
jgi:hypothetical protein